MKTYTWMDMFGGVRGFIFACLFVLALASFGIQTWRLNGAKVDVAESAVKLALLESAQADNLRTITDLKETNAELAEGRRIDKEASEAAVAKLRQEREEALTRLALERKARQRINQDDPYAAQRALTPVPRALYERLLLLQAGDQDPHR